MRQPKLVLRDITKTFGSLRKERVTAVEGISLEVAEGAIVSLIGPSGCGKSTLLDLVAGLSLPDEGDIKLDGEPITGKKGFVSYMPQKDVLFPWRTILDNVIIPLEIRGVDRKEAREEALALVPRFGLEGFAYSYPYALSGGMRQRASFLRTYLCRKEIMLLDEPFGKLDALTRRQMQKWLMEMWHNFRQTVLFVTHDVDEAVLLSDRVYVLSARPGRIIDEVEVNLPRPRTGKMAVDREFTGIKARLLQSLEEGMAEQVGENA